MDWKGPGPANMPEFLCPAFRMCDVSATTPYNTYILFG